jgi:single-stranded-DNA-specific exonuclease
LLRVDCGIRGFEPIELGEGKRNGRYRHRPSFARRSAGKSAAYAVVNPNQTGCEYPDKNLAGVGVAFKLAHALLREKGRENLVRGFLKSRRHRHDRRYYEF